MLRSFPDLRSFLDPTRVLTLAGSPSKREILVQVARSFEGHPAIADHRGWLKALYDREDVTSTGIGGGIAIPHGRMPTLTTPRGVFARLAQPIAFDSIDERPVDIVFLLVAPEGAGADHLKALARVSRLLRDRSLVDKLRATESAEALYALLAESVQAQSAA